MPTGAAALPVDRGAATARHRELAQPLGQLAQMAQEEMFTTRRRVILTLMSTTVRIGFASLLAVLVALSVGCRDLEAAATVSGARSETVDALPGFDEPWNASFEVDHDGALSLIAEDETTTPSEGVDSRLVVRLPATADGALRIEAPGAGGGRWVEERLVGAARSVHAEVIEGRVSYEGARRGVDRIHQVSAERVEEYLRIADARAAEELTYEVVTGPTIADLVVDGSGFGLVAIDATGTTVLRAPRPIGVDAHADLVEGRLLVARESEHHFAVRVDLSGARPSFPILLDPSWVSTGSMAFARTLHTATRLTDGRVLLVGGTNASGFVTSAELYDPTTGTWSTTGSLVGRYEHTATLLADGRVLVTGGAGGGAALLNNPQLYDPVAGTWSAAADMNVAREHHTATLLPDGRVLVAAGYGSGPTQLTSAELYNPTTGMWTLTGSLAVARFDHTATLLSTGRVLVAAGCASTMSVAALASAELYDPTAGTWSTTGALAVARCSHADTLLADGDVLVASGSDSGTDVPSTEIYDTVAGTWSTTGPLSIQRQGHTVTLLQNGFVLMVSNFNSGTTFPNAELYDPSLGAWSGVDSVLAPRQRHTATLLENGQVLVAGGNVGAISGGADSAELYTFLLPLGAACTLASECLSDNCSGDVCCAAGSSCVPDAGAVDAAVVDAAVVDASAVEDAGADAAPMIDAAVATDASRSDASGADAGTGSGAASGGCACTVPGGRPPLGAGAGLGLGLLALALARRRMSAIRGRAGGGAGRGSRRRR